MRLLGTKIVEKPWGKDVLPPQFDVPEGKRIGEVWFEPPQEMPDVLVKYIFTSEKLSVQVHPSDAQAMAQGESDRGKEECWLVIDAEPGAALGVGFKEPVDAETMRRAALDGSIEELMEWYLVSSGDFIYIPAGTVHAIGAGITLLEMQQNSDITYRLYDYGRPRELHLDAGIAVAEGAPHEASLRFHLNETDTRPLVANRLFKIDRVYGVADEDVLARHAKATLAIPLNGMLKADNEELEPGTCGFVESARNLEFTADGSCLLVSAGT